MSGSTQVRIHNPDQGQQRPCRAPTRSVACTLSAWRMVARRILALWRAINAAAARSPPELWSRTDSALRGRNQPPPAHLVCTISLTHTES